MVYYTAEDNRRELVYYTEYKRETESRILYRNNTSGILYKISRKIFCAICTEKHKQTK